MKGVLIKCGLLTMFGVDMQKVVVKGEFWPKRHCRTQHTSHPSTIKNLLLIDLQSIHLK